MTPARESENVWTSEWPSVCGIYWMRREYVDAGIAKWTARLPIAPLHEREMRSLHPIPSAEELAALRKLVEVARHVANQLYFYPPTDKERAEHAESLRAAIKECEQP